ncbi:thiamine pyrophosphate-binding protein [Microbacterium immunditiarum]|uniref:Thiamine pyrophosphate-dependent acetolactate synthase large subunit-like protein n=1 Tax=Microbacterium immunditiarum TaxID=337480 RepID=A0A7Y9GRX0_9MICO|nr:thiamine pyrophosphate-binding protein [Microbacterium immunditiarum]NYE21508.1 thiamine pyrophosphate-dependent acetolactate synthase large subunit-like protein [Microbacterium immunditiarum]
MKVFAALARSLSEDHDVSTVFGLLGAGTMMVVDELVNRHGARCVRMVREDGAVLGALGYQHSTGRLGVAAIGAGPALTNAFTALVEAARNHSPLLVIADDRFEMPGNVQGIDQAAVVAPTGAAYVEVRSVATAVDDLGRAVRIALVEQRPVVLDLPTSIAMSDFDGSPSQATNDDARTPSAARTDVDAAATLIERATKPLLLAGWGAFLADARGDLDVLAERLGAPVATTMKAKSFFSGSPASIGTFGGFSSDQAKAVIRDSDLIIAFGAGLNVWTADHGYLLEDKAIIQVDRERANIGAIFPQTLGIVGDVRDVAGALHAELDRRESSSREAWSGATPSGADTAEPAPYATSRAAGTVDLHEFTMKLEQAKPRGANVVTDGGRYVIAPMQHLTVESPRHWLAPIGGFGSIGLALGAAMGVAVGRPDAPTVLVVGDGAFMMSHYELHTAVRNSLDLIVVVMNDRSYSSEYHFYLASESEDSELATALTTFDWPDFGDMARSLGFDAVTVTSIGDFAAVSSAIEERTRPLLVDVHLDPLALVGFHDRSEQR